MLEWLDGATFGDPSRVHVEGLAARQAVEVAREQVAGLLGCRGRSVVLTSGGTESIAAACWGAAGWGERGAAGRGERGAAGRGERGAAGRGEHQVLAAVEHSAVRASAEALGDVTIVPVDGLGRVDVDQLVAAVEPRTGVVHLQWANHEVGTRQPVAEAVAACREHGVLVHVDAVVGAGHDPIDFDGLGADLLTVSSHKLGGPPGAGALLVRRGLRIRPLLLGGDQERARRAGMENVPAFAGFGAACAALATDDRMAAEAADARRRTDRVLAAAGSLDGVRVHGDPADRAPHLVCLGFDDVEPQAVLLGLDRAGVAVHSGSACSSESLEPSPVLEAMGVDALRSLRVSVGWSTTDDDVDALLDALPRTLGELRALRR